MNKLGIIIQARTGSTRLPSKMILPFYGNDGILSILLSRLTLCKLADSIIVETSSLSPDDAICYLVREHRVKCFRGDENEVLDRFIQAARYYGISKIIRFCADNPFLDIGCSIKLKILLWYFSKTSFAVFLSPKYSSICNLTPTNLVTICKSSAIISI